MTAGQHAAVVAAGHDDAPCASVHWLDDDVGLIPVRPVFLHQAEEQRAAAIDHLGPGC
jgi:hypothetical protein